MVLKLIDVWHANMLNMEDQGNIQKYAKKAPPSSSEIFEILGF